MKRLKTPRILHVIDHFYPQLGYQETFLSLAEIEQGYDVYVLTGNLVDKTIYEANREILRQEKTAIGESNERGIKTIRLPSFRLPLVNTIYLLGLEKAIEKLKPDVIICHGLVFIQTVKIAKLKKRLPKFKLIIDDHMTYNATRGGIFRFVYALFKSIFTPTVLKSADMIVAVTYETKKFMKEIYGIPEEKITIIPLGVDTILFRRDPTTRDEIRERYGINDDDVVFIYAGKIIPEKGPHLLIEATLKMLNEYHNLKVMLVGGSKNDYKRLLDKKTSSSGFEKNFIFISAVTNKELYKYYSAADVGVWPLQCSVTMLEAMSCDLPVIISSDSGALERISEGNGLSYREGDTNNLAEKMKIMLNPELRKTMSLNARKYAKKNDWNIISKKFL